MEIFSTEKLLNDVSATSVNAQLHASFEHLFIVLQFVDMGFGIHTGGPLGDVENETGELAPEAVDGVNCEDRKNDIENKDAPPGRKRTGARKAK
ncbi:MAG: hypothetical protein AAF668_00570 [Pseudomonadota bacterium]